MILRFKYKRNNHQALFHEDVHSKYLHLTSGFGGGKTYALAMKAIQLSWINRPMPGGILCPTYGDFKRDFLPIWEDIMHANAIHGWDYHGGDHYFKVPWSRGRIYVVTAERKLRGPNWAWCCINEASLISEVRYKEAIGRVRMRAADAPQIASVGTPEGFGTWDYDFFVENPRANSRIIYGSTRANAQNLSDDYIQSIENSYDEKMRDAFLDGKYINMAGSMFYYAFDRQRNVSRETVRVPGQKVLVMVDFNVTPFCASFWHADPESRNPYSHCFDELEINDMNTDRFCDALLARGYTPEICSIYPDPAGKARSTKGTSDFEVLRRRGFTDIRARMVAPQLRRRQLCMNNLLEKGVIKINPNCTGVIRDFERVEQDAATFEKVKTNARLTHFSDGADYGHDILFPLSGNRPGAQSIKFR